jgi:hypothetical protein
MRRGRCWCWLLIVCCGCSNEDADRLGRVCRRAAGQVLTHSEPARAKLARGWHALRRDGSANGLESTVVARLRQDKSLAAASIEVRVLGEGVVELHGQVADEKQRHRAVELVDSTVGVERVVDELAAGDKE